MSFGETSEHRPTLKCMEKPEKPCHLGFLGCSVSLCSPLFRQSGSSAWGFHPRASQQGALSAMLNVIHPQGNNACDCVDVARNNVAHPLISTNLFLVGKYSDSPIVYLHICIPYRNWRSISQTDISFCSERVVSSSCVFVLPWLTVGCLWGFQIFSLTFPSVHLLSIWALENRAW